MGDTVVAEGLSSGEAPPVARWVQSRLDAGSSPKAIRAQFYGTSESDPTEAPADLSVLDGAVKDVKAALDEGGLDAHLDALEAAEHAGKGRKGVLSAIASRRDARS
ncbi:MAG: hypothetical protein R3F61_02280 [Myxococcota bacterium]